MLYCEWIRLFGMAVQLFNLTEMNRETTVGFRWEKPDSLIFLTNSDLNSLYIDISTPDNYLLATYVMIPWQDLYEPITSAENIVPIRISWDLITVNEFALVYCIYENPDLKENQKKCHEKYKFFLKKLFDVDANNKVLNQADGVTSVDGLQLITQMDYRYYIVQKIAVPGSRIPMSRNQIESGKMVLRYFVPDIGKVRLQWIVSGQAINDNCILSHEKQIITLFDSALQVCISDPGINRRMVFEQTITDYEGIINVCNDRTEFSTEYGNALLKQFLYIREPGLRELFEDNPFSGYVPKNTPDNASDYMPAVTEYFEKLPNAELPELCKLLSEFKKYNKLARKNRGRWVDGNMILGARPKEYEPSLEELILGETGERITKIVNNFKKDEIISYKKNNRCQMRKIKFRKFTFTHADVMGSGRFFYVDTIEEIKLKL